MTLERKLKEIRTRHEEDKLIGLLHEGVDDYKKTHPRPTEHQEIIKYHQAMYQHSCLYILQKIEKEETEVPTFYRRQE